MPILRNPTWLDWQKGYRSDLPMSKTAISVAKAKINREAWLHDQTMDCLNTTQKKSNTRSKNELDKLQSDFIRMKARSIVYKMHAFQQYDPYINSDSAVTSLREDKRTKKKTKTEKGRKLLRKRKEKDSQRDEPQSDKALDSRRDESPSETLSKESNEHLEKQEGRKSSKRKGIAKITMPTILEEYIETQMSILEAKCDDPYGIDDKQDEIKMNERFQNNQKVAQQSNDNTQEILGKVERLSMDNVNLLNHVNVSVNEKDVFQDIGKQCSVFPISGHLVKHMYGWQARVEKEVLPDVFEPIKRRKRIVKPPPKQKSLFPEEFNSVFTLNKFYESETDKVLEDGEVYKQLSPRTRQSNNGKNYMRRRKTSSVDFREQHTTLRNAKEREYTIS